MTFKNLLQKINNRLQNPDAFSRIVAFTVLLILFLCLKIFGGGFFEELFSLAVGGNVKELARFLYSFGPLAIVVSFILDVVINAAGFLPSIFMSTANGLIFGLPLGILISWLAETTGVTISFLFMRFFFRAAAEKLIKRADKLKDIDRASEKNGFIWMTFARALPYFPSGILTAIGAVSRMSVKDYILANLIGKFPSTALEVIIGHDVVDYKESGLRLSILVIVAAVIFYFGRKKVFGKRK